MVPNDLALTYLTTSLTYLTTSLTYLTTFQQQPLHIFDDSLS